MRLQRPLRAAGGLAILLCGMACARPAQVEAEASDTPITHAELGAPDRPQQLLYVPVHSHIERKHTRAAVDLQVTLIVRNTDERNAIRIDSVRSHAASGHLLDEHLSRPLILAPMAVRQIVSSEGDEAGNLASFIVGWSSGEPVRAPIVEALMVSSQGARGLSFRSVGHALDPPQQFVDSE